MCKQGDNSNLCHQWDEKYSIRGLSHASGHVDLALDLLPGPASSLNSPLAVLPSCPGLADQGSDPLAAEEGCKLAVGECISKVTR